MSPSRRSCASPACCTIGRRWSSDQPRRRQSSASTIHAMSRSSTLSPPAAAAALDADTLVGPDSVDVARLAAGAAVAAVDAVLTATGRRAFALVRPPGHHATPRARHGLLPLQQRRRSPPPTPWRSGLERVLIVDWDVHHGNGTQDAFYESDAVLFCSVHQSPLYPGTGAATERGRGRGEGYTLNVPLPPVKATRSIGAFSTNCSLPAARDYRPELVLVSAGFDAHAADPLAGMRLTEAGFADLARRVVDLAEECAGGRVVAVLEGGYDPTALGRSVAAGRPRPRANRHRVASRLRTSPTEETEEQPGSAMSSRPPSAVPDRSTAKTTSDGATRRASPRSRTRSTSCGRRCASCPVGRPAARRCSSSTRAAAPRTAWRSSSSPGDAPNGPGAGARRESHAATGRRARDPAGGRGASDPLAPGPRHASCSTPPARRPTTPASTTSATTSCRRRSSTSRPTSTATR